MNLAFYLILVNLNLCVLINVNVDNLDITLCGEKVIHCDSETYLGVSLNSDIRDRVITQTVCSFYQKSNHVVTAGLSEQLTLSFYSIFICVVFVTFREVL